MDEEKLRRVADRGDRDEIVEHVVAQRLERVPVDDDAGVDEADGVAVRGGPGDRLPGDIAAGAGAVLDHRRLAGLGRDIVAERPQQQIAEPARRVRRDELDRAIRIGLGNRRSAQQRERKADEEGTRQLHCIAPMRATEGA
jgi:hypothetical protein